MLRLAVAVLALSALTLGLAAAKPPERSYPIEKAAPLLKSKSRVDIMGDRAWHLDGCELSWTGP